MRIVKSSIIPTLTYGFQTLSLTNEDNLKTDNNSTRSVKRSILGIQKTRHTVIREKSGRHIIDCCKTKMAMCGTLGQND